VTERDLSDQRCRRDEGEKAEHQARIGEVVANGRRRKHDPRQREGHQDDKREKRKRVEKSSHFGQCVQMKALREDGACHHQSEVSWMKRSQALTLHCGGFDGRGFRGNHGGSMARPPANQRSA